MFPQYGLEESSPILLDWHKYLWCPETNSGPRTPCETCASLRATIDKVEKEKEEALREQNETFQKQLEEISRNRKRLEEERLKTLRQRIRKELEEEMEELRRTWKAESTAAVEEACQETQRQAERERERQMQAVKEAAESYYKQCVKDAVAETVAEERKRSEMQKISLRRRHEEELKSFQEKICAVQEQLTCVVREKNDFESQFKELQLNYKRFIDLTDSALHSDYLLRLIRLGKPPGYAHCAIQTDEDVHP
ncbi:golgin subfamily A member 6-like protein 1 isoform X2 [Hyla sarda]|uniref:golgin subfamily A member 6-like protein 1 isoform X2 n=1 Tax=Hyla sarda TaxID=327740 RepID=UPI0024C2D4B1|nr:golgin subfamily A member 6-like protein 1 isoform X2 [Hyla sarda]